MSDTLQDTLQSLAAQVPIQISEFRGETTLIVAASRLVELCRLLRDQHGFNMLEDETAVDYFPQENPRFHLVCQLYSTSRLLRLCLRAPLDGNAPAVSSLTAVYPNANWHERELWDLFGIYFENHPDLRRILMPHDWEGHPLRKDYPLGHEEVMFSFNYDEIDGRKPYARREPPASAPKQG